MLSSKINYFLKKLPKLQKIFQNIRKNVILGENSGSRAKVRAAGWCEPQKIGVSLRAFGFRPGSMPSLVTLQKTRKKGGARRGKAGESRDGFGQESSSSSRNVSRAEPS